MSCWRKWRMLDTEFEVGLEGKESMEVKENGERSNPDDLPHGLFCLYD